MTQDAAVRRNIQKLQRAIVDGLEDVKAQDIRVFNTEQQSPLFERVIVATGSSNRQTKALAASVRDAVREAGFDKPRIEGEEVGEWIVVDCGAAVAHIMQPAIRQYYHLEDIWGDKPVRVRLGPAAAKTSGARPRASDDKPAATRTAKADDPSRSKKAEKPETSEKSARPATKSGANRVVARAAIQAPAGSGGGARSAPTPTVRSKSASAARPAAPAGGRTAAKSAAKPAARAAARPGQMRSATPRPARSVRSGSTAAPGSARKPRA